MVSDDEFVRRAAELSSTVSSPAFQRLLRQYTETVHQNSGVQEAVDRTNRMLRDSIDTNSIAKSLEVAEVADRVLETLGRTTWALTAEKAAAALQPVMDQYLSLQPARYDWAKHLLEDHLARRVVSTWQLRQTSSASLSVKVPTRDEVEELRELAESNVIPAEELSEFEREVAEVSVLDEILEAAVDDIVTDHPFITREQARKIVVVMAYVAWVASIVGITVFTGPVGGILATALGTMTDAERVSRGAGALVDKAPRALFADDEERNDDPPVPPSGDE